MWKKTSRFIVDSYHYTNHRANDELCRKYCNPAPTDGSAPNLVGQKVDKNGVVHDVREFNTQTCEQLNAWLGGFETILKRMTSKNFNWFLHVMLFYHVKHVLAKLSVPPVAENQDDDSQDEPGSSSSEEESISSSDVESNSSDKDNGSLSFDENSDDNDTKDTITNSDDEDTNDEMIEKENGDEEDMGLSSDEISDDNDTKDTTSNSDDEDTNDEMIEEENEEEDEDEMDVDDD
jgi:hypothetical protein